MKPLILFFGNPLLDISVKISDSKLLEKYELKEDDQREIDSEVIDDILCDISPSLQEFPNLPNGVCVCLIKDDHRSLVANVGAAAHFSLDFLLSSEDLQRFIKESHIIHIEGYFLSNRFQVCQYIVENSQRKHKKILTYNINGAYVCEELPEESSFMAENADIVIGNFLEYETLGKKKYGTDTAEETALRLHAKWREIRKVNEVFNGVTNVDNSHIYENNIRRLGKVLAITHNSRPVLVIWGKDDCNKQLIPVPELNQKDILDTTGAGDAFMGGFFFALLSGASPATAARYACAVASQMISRIGTEVPSTPAPSLELFQDEGVNVLGNGVHRPTPLVGSL